MAHKTLIIGVGTTGMEMAEDVVHRITGEWGKLSKVPWIKAIAFETNQSEIVDSYMGKNGLVWAIGLPSNQYQPLVTAPASFDKSIEFTKWRHAGTINLQGACDMGAGNIRMVGRAAFMHPTSFVVFDAQVSNALHELTDLTAQKATEMRGELPDGTNPPVDLDDSIKVFVCGTLTGGTCSGCFIDMGYYLKTLPGYKLDVVGLFSIPNPAYATAVHNANAVAALSELNHYHTRGSTYHAKFSTRVAPTDVSGVLPFSSVFICAPKAATGDAKTVLTRSFGQFMYLYGVSPVGGDFFAKLVDPTARYFHLRDREDRPISFNSVGVSVIEYPAEHIIRACSAKLASEAAALWVVGNGCDSSSSTTIIINQPKNDGGPALGLNTTSVRAELRKPPQGKDPFEKTIGDSIEDGIAAAKGGDFATLSLCEQNIEMGFQSGAAVGNIQPGLFVDAIKTNAKELQERKLSNLKELFRDRIMDAASGPVWCKQFAEALLLFCKSWKESLAANDARSLGDDRAAMDSASRRIDECHRAVVLKAGWKGTALKHCCDEYREAANNYWGRRLDESCAPYERALCDAIIAVGNRVIARLSDPVYGMLLWGENLNGLLADLYKKLDQTPPVVNGRLLYKPGATVDFEFARCLDDVHHDSDKAIEPRADKAEFAKRKIVRQWQWIGDQLVADPFKSIFDPPQSPGAVNNPVPVLDGHIEGLVTLGRPYFLRVLGEKAIELLMADANWRQAVDEANKEKGKAFAEISDTLNPVGAPSPAGAYHLPRLAFFEGAPTAQQGSFAFDLKTHLQPTIQHFYEHDEHHRIVFVEGRSAFSLGGIKGMDPAIDKGFLDAFVDQSSHIFLYSRWDVRWRGIDASAKFQNRALFQARLLAAIAYGIIDKAAVDSYLYSYKAMGPNMPAGTLQLSNDLDDGAYALRENRNADLSLQRDLQTYEGCGIDEMAQKIKAFADAVSVYGLKSNGEDITTETVAALIEPYVESLNGLREALADLYPRRFTADDYLVGENEIDESVHPIAGYYCRCGVHMAGLGQPCPNVCPACGRNLF